MFKYIIISILILSSTLAFSHNEVSKDGSIDPKKLDKNFTHFELGKGEKILLVEPYTSFSDIISGKTENYTYSDYRGTKFTAMELLHPLGVIINKIAPKGTEMLADSIVKKINSKYTVLNEILTTANDFFNAMEARAPIVPPSQGQALAHGAEALAEAVAPIAVTQYSDAIKAKLEEAFKQVYEKYKADFESGAIEKVREALFEKTLSALNDYMASYYDPEQYVFKGIILGGNTRGDLVKLVDKFASKAIPPIISENGHIKGSIGVILHSPRKITTLSSFSTQEVLKEKTVFTVTPTVWLAARLKKSAHDKTLPANSEGQKNGGEDQIKTANANQTNFVSPADTLHWTGGTIWGERNVDPSTLDSYEGIFFEMNFFVLGVAININQSFFFGNIMHPATPSASAITFSIEHSGFKKIRREELRSGLGKLKITPNAGYIKLIPFKNYSIDISTL